MDNVTRYKCVHLRQVYLVSCRVEIRSRDVQEVVLNKVNKGRHRHLQGVDLVVPDACVNCHDAALGSIMQITQ